MSSSTARLGLAPDDHSDAVVGYNTIGTAPQYSSCVNNRYGAGPTPHSDEGADMPKRTRGPDPVDRWTRISGVNITPPTHADPVTSTPTVA